MLTLKYIPCTILINSALIIHMMYVYSLHSIFVPYYYTNDADSISVLFTTKQLLKGAQFSILLQGDVTYKLTWNELPLLVFGSSYANRHFSTVRVDFSIN